MPSIEFLNAEHASRLAARTSSSGKGYYDHVVAVSQSMVNAAFADMHAKNKPLREIHKEISKGNEVHGELHPTQILVQGGDTGITSNKVYWMIHFKTGWIKLKLGDSEDVVNIDDWKLAVEVEFEQRSLKFLDEDSASEIKMKEIQMKSLKGRFLWEEDRYDPSFLYAKLTTGLARGFSREHTTYGVDKQTGNPIKIDDLLATMGKDFPVRYGLLTTCLNVWAGPLQDKGLTVVATQFQAPKTKKVDASNSKSVKTSSKPVKELVLQTSPYLLSVPGETGHPNGATILEDPGSRNCICYCEVIEGHELPAAEKPYLWSGNFATIGKKLGDPSRIDGTFALSRNLFFESLLLPNLRNFASASIIAPKAATFSSNNRYVSSEWSREYGVHHKSVDTVNFNPVFDNDPNVPNKYKFMLIGNDVPSGTTPYKNSQTNRYYFHQAKANTTVDVCWKPGTKDVDVQGQVEYSYTQTAGKDGTILPSGELKDGDSVLKDAFIASWKFTLRLSGITDGELKMDIAVPLEVKVKRDEAKHAAQFFVVPKEQDEDIKTELQKSLSSQLIGFETILKSLLKSDLKYVYPGVGTFDFGDIMFNNNGDLLVDIKYKSIDVGKLITLPDPYEILDWKFPVPTSGKSTETSQPHPDTTLAWGVTKTAKANESKQLITVSAKNESEEAKYMKEMEIALDVYSDTSILPPGVTTISKTKIFVQTEGIDQEFDTGSNAFCIRDKPKGSLNLTQMEKQVLKRTDARTRCIFSVKSKDDDIKIPANSTVFVDFLFETGGPGSCEFEVEEMECTETGEKMEFDSPTRGQGFRVTLV